MYILIILYNLNLLLNSFVNFMVKNINLFNYKNSTQFTKNKFFFDIFFGFYIYQNTYARASLSLI
jgi:hypothetical protein